MSSNVLNRKPLSQVAFPTRRAYPHLMDATEALDTEVVWELDVKGATVCDRHNCPLARSLLRMPTVNDVVVTDHRVFIEFTDGRLLRYVNPHHEITQRYDWDTSFSPGVYTLKAPTRSERIGKQRGSNMEGSQTRRTKRSLR